VFLENFAEFTLEKVRKLYPELLIQEQKWGGGGVENSFKLDQPIYNTKPIQKNMILHKFYSSIKTCHPQSVKYHKDYFNNSSFFFLVSNGLLNHKRNLVSK
jgi:hypothetical protein